MYLDGNKLALAINGTEYEDDLCNVGPYVIGMMLQSVAMSTRPTYTRDLKDSNSAGFIDRICRLRLSAGSITFFINIKVHQLF